MFCSRRTANGTLHDNKPSRLHEFLPYNSGFLTCLVLIYVAFVVVNHNRIMLGISEGLNYLHNLENPIIHRDLKSLNVLIAHPSYTPKIADIGIARELPTDLIKTHVTTVHVEYSLLWAPPELFRQDVDGKYRFGPASDIWSLAVIFYEILSGKAPWHKKKSYEVMNAIATGEKQVYMSQQTYN